MTLRQRALLISLSLPLLGLTAGCGSLTGGDDKAKVDEENPTTVALVLVDVSKSTYGKGGAQRQRYAAAFEQIVHALPSGTLLKADIIDSNPLSTSSLPISEFYEKYEGPLGKKNKFQIKKQHEAAATDAITKFNSLLRQRPKGNSILDSLDIAQKVFDSFPSAETRYLVIFSDMVEASNRYRFTNQNLESANVEAFIADEEKAGRLPELSGVEVYVAGAGATRGADASPARTRLIKRFWLSYFSAAQAGLSSPRYGPTLIRFP